MTIDEEDDDEISNETRAEHALAAIMEHQRVTEGKISGPEVLDNLEEYATDAVADIFHLLHLKGLDPEKIANRAMGHFEEEISGDEEEDKDGEK